MRVLLIGSGGREHALAWGLANSENCTELFCAPGNAGIAQIAKCVDIPVTDIPAICDFAQKNMVDFVVVGPEGPLVAGLVDALDERKILSFGPNKAAAILEGSKGYMKDFFARHNIPTAAFGRFQDAEKAQQFIRDHGAPIVLKTDGLAAGKGVIIAQNVDEAYDTAASMLSGDAFGAAGREIVIEAFLKGTELSFFALCDGETAIPLTSAQDYKRAGDGDTGPNTGGMGAYSPSRLMDADLEEKIMQRIILPTIDGMKAEGRPFKGVLYAGLMIDGGEPYIIEYNVRFGDPECQVLIPRLHGDLLDILYKAATGRLDEVKDDLQWADRTTVTVVMAANGYPGSYENGSVICGTGEADNMQGVKIFHAGTALDADGQLTAKGGRVLNVTAAGQDAKEACEKAYAAIDAIDWPGGFCRRDIAHDAQ